MWKAAPVVNPIMQGTGRKATITLNRQMYMINWIIPTIRVAVIAFGILLAYSGDRTLPPVAFSVRDKFAVASS